MATYQRARQAEQKQQRRLAILDAAWAMYQTAPYESLTIAGVPTSRLFLTLSACRSTLSGEKRRDSGCETRFPVRPSASVSWILR